MSGMVPASLAQSLERECRALREEVDSARELIPKLRRQVRRVQQIAEDHKTCECSAALMILEVLSDG